MTEITREADISLEVMSYGWKAKEKKTDNKQLTRKKEKKQKTN